MHAQENERALENVRASPDLQSLFDILLFLLVLLSATPPSEFCFC